MARVESPRFVATAYQAVDRAVGFYNQTKILKPVLLTATLYASRLGSWGLLIDGGQQIIFEGNLGRGVIEILAGLKAVDIDNWAKKQLFGTTRTYLNPIDFD